MATMKLKVGEKAPEFCLPDQDDKPVCLKDFAGHWVVVYFYPKDQTPGCTKEACEFTERLGDFTNMDATVLGVSTDSAASHRKFAAKNKLAIELLSDAKHETIAAYGAWQPKKFMGREFLGTVRSTFIIDPKGRIVHIWPSVNPWGHAGEVRKKLAELSGEEQKPEPQEKEILPPPSLI
ncbi:thioredoxin-dependent thiol peroxidase [candidate division WOR-3 bacterium]|nr:thioredoxin-dependent thiol peroxidase [candidate division WOR-3 bacterium]